MSNQDNVISAELVEADSIRASEIRLTDCEDRERIALYTTDDGTPVIALLDADECERLRLSLAQDGSSAIALQDAKGMEQLRIATDASGEPRIILNDREHVLRMSIAVDGRGPRISMFDTSKNERLSISVGADGKPYITFHAADGRDHVQISVPDDGSACVELRSVTDGMVRIPWPAGVK